MNDLELELRVLAWRQLRTRIESLCVIFAAGALVSMAPDLDRTGPEFRAVFIAVWTALSVLTIAFVCRLATLAGTECPRCAQAFFHSAWGPLVRARRCAHCQLALPSARPRMPSTPPA